MPKSRLSSRIFRDNAIGQILLCTILGAAVGLITIFLHDLASWMRQIAFGLSPQERLSSATNLSKFRILLVPIIGGLILGYVMVLMKRWRSNEIVDPIEANAIYGGRMSVIDSLRLLFATLISNGAGVSIGMEAAYTQVGASATSKVGHVFHLRREDQRVFLAAGAAAAIAAAFNAPMAGAFYAFELVLGAYKINALAPVVMASIAGALMLHLAGESEPIFSLTLEPIRLGVQDYSLFAVTGIVSAALAILTMKLVTTCEHVGKKLHIPEWGRPAMGGFIIGMLALAFPQVLGSGQGAIIYHLHSQWPLSLLIGLLLAKVLASAISIGSGFRGGLFSAALFLGCILGQIFGTVASNFNPYLDSRLEYFMLVGIGSVGAAIVGSPFTMVLLVLEMTGNFPATLAVLLGVMVASTITRYSFGYSFSTWRFHLRGLRIKGPQDVGWVNELTVDQLMWKGTKTVLSSMYLNKLRTSIPAGSIRRVFVMDENNRYDGIIETADIFDPDLNAFASQVTAHDLAKGREYFLTPAQNIREALSLFTLAELEELPVLDAKSGKILGHVGESHLLKRYNHELEAHNAN